MTPRKSPAAGRLGIAPADTTDKPKSETHVRATFHLPRPIVADLAGLIGQLKAQARTTAGKAPSMSDLVAEGLQTVIAEKRKSIKS